METQTIQFSLSSFVATLKLNQPQTHNALNSKMIFEFHQILDEINRHKVCLLVV